MKRKTEIRLHLIFWLAYIFMAEFSNIIFRDNYHFNIYHSIEYFPFTMLQMLIFYLNYSVICPKTIPNKHWFVLLMAEIGLLLLFPGIRYLIEEVIMYAITGEHNYTDQSRKFWFYIFDNSYYSIRIILFSTFFYAIKYALKTGQNMSTLQLEKKQAELQALKNQLSPHFLFNTLNSFYADLFDTQPRVADDILKLSEMLRYVTYENEGNYVVISDEIEFLKNYIDLFKRRFDNNVFVKFDYPIANIQSKIPSLLLIHFVENAFKHGTLDTIEAPVIINLAIKDNHMHFTVTNKYKINEHYDEAGIGQKNIEQRLALLYQNNYSLNTTKTDDIYSIELNIPLRQ